ncbi:MAG: ABC transporter [Chloroflexi bacterium]|nr:ABC transporter [Chloroflexota bacterium]
MTAIAAPRRVAVEETAAAGTSFALQVGILLSRLLRQLAVAPTTYINLMISLFFLFVYTGAFGASQGFEQLIGAKFLTFILPVSIVNASLAGSVAGQLLVSDLESGYLRRLQAMPISRLAIVLAPMLVGALLVVAQAALVLGLGFAMGVESATGVAGVAVVLALSLLWGMAFAGYAVATGLLAGNAATAQAATFVFFPLVFLAPTFLPREQLQDWLQAAAVINPTTYVLEAMRSVLIDGWQLETLAAGFGVIGGLCLLASLWAARVARRTTARR